MSEDRIRAFGRTEFGLLADYQCKSYFRVSAGHFSASVWRRGYNGEDLYFHKVHLHGRGGITASYHEDITANEAGLGSKIASDCWLALWLKRRIFMHPSTNSNTVFFSLINYFLPVLRQVFTIPFIFIHDIVIVVLIIVFFITLSP